MNFIHRLIRNLVLPNNAGAGQTRLVLGPDLPPPLNTYLFGGTTLASNAIIWYSGVPGDTSYKFLAFANLGTTFTLYMGDVQGGAVLETSAGVPSGQRWGFTGLGTQFLSFALGELDDFFIDSISQSRGSVDHVSSTASTAAIGAEAVVLTGTVITWHARRAYAINVVNPAIIGSIVGNNVLRRVRRNNIAGTDLSDAIGNQNNTITAGSGTATNDRVIVRNATGANIVDNVVATLEANGGGTVQSVAGGVRVRYMQITDIGASANFPNAPQI